MIVNLVVSRITEEKRQACRRFLGLEIVESPYLLAVQFHGLGLQAAQVGDSELS